MGVMDSGGGEGRGAFALQLHTVQETSALCRFPTSSHCSTPGSLCACDVFPAQQMRRQI